MELAADWGLTLRVLEKRLSALELRQLCLHAADGHGYVNAMDWSAPDGGAPRLLMETAGNELHGPASIAIGLLEHLLKPERVAVCEAIPVAGHPKREALLTDRALHSCTADLLFGTSAAGCRDRRRGGAAAPLALQRIHQPGAAARDSPRAVRTARARRHRRRRRRLRLAAMRGVRALRRECAASCGR
jgi:hypothetical protein